MSISKGPGRQGSGQGSHPGQGIPTLPWKWDFPAACGGDAGRGGGERAFSVPLARGCEQMWNPISPSLPVPLSPSTCGWGRGHEGCQPQAVLAPPRLLQSPAGFNALPCLAAHAARMVTGKNELGVKGGYQILIPAVNSAVWEGKEQCIARLVPSRYHA